MARKLVVDTSSLLHFLEFYYFDRDYEKDIHSKLTGFLMAKIESGEMVVIDKVFAEINTNSYTVDLKTGMESYVVNTLFLAPKVGDLIKKYYISGNETFLKNDPNQIDLELKRYENGSIADLYLVAYSNHLKKPGDQIILITDESRGKTKN